MIKYSIIIPTYNSQEYILRCINSILYQTYKYYEILIIDNSSQDNTIKLVKDLNITKNIKIIEGFQNSGVIAKSRNAGIYSASGEWICFLDSDDFWHPNKLMECDKFTKDFEVIYHKLRYYDNINNNIVFKHLCDTNNLINDPYKSYLDLGIALTTSGTIVKKNILIKLQGFDEDKELIGGEDLDLWLRLAKNKFRFKYIEKVLAYYMLGGNHHVTSDRTGLTLNAALKRKLTKDKEVIYWIELSLFRINLSLKKLNFLKLVFRFLKSIGFKNIIPFIFFLTKRLSKRFVNYFK